MLSKNQIKAVQALKQKKFRDEQGLFIAEGTKIVPELLASAIEVKEVYASVDFFRKNKINKNVLCVEVKAAELERISALTTPNEVLAICSMPEPKLELNSLKEKLSLVLDDIRDPGNLGTIIRIADWFGIENIICSENTADVYNPKVVQATMGSIARVKVHYSDLKYFLGSQVSGLRLPVYGTLLRGKNIYKEKLSSEGLIIIGNESKGISAEIEKLITTAISIPSFSNSEPGEAESLNAAIATAVVCSEFRRR